MRLKFPYSEELVALVRSVPGRKYRPDDRSWDVPHTQLTAEILRGTPLEIIDPITHRLELPIEYRSQRKPYAHQRKITQHILTEPTAIFAETGTGKTQCVVDAVRAEYTRKHLIVCPAPLLSVWQQEFPEVHVAHGPDRSYATVCLTSYDTLARDLENDRSPYWRLPRDILGKVSWHVVYCDESQLVKNPSTKRHKTIAKLVADKKIILTGTPYGNAWKDVWAQLRISFPEIGTMSHFYDYFCEFDEWGGIKSYRNLDVLQRIIARCAVAVRKADCLDLPPKQYQTVKLEMSAEQKTLYNRAKKGGIGDKAIDSLGKIQVMRQISSGFSYDLGKSFPCPKPEYLRAIGWDTPTIIWVNYKEEVNQIEEVLTNMGVNYSVADGDHPASEAVAQFNAGAVDVLIANLASVQYGFTCNRATRVIYYSPSFSQMQRSQSEDRCHRLGQTKSVLYVDLLGSPLEKYMRDAISKHVEVKDYILEMLTKGEL
jgi:SNF2 family DNA or RNA helicase